MHPMLKIYSIVKHAISGLGHYVSVTIRYDEMVVVAGLVVFGPQPACRTVEESSHCQVLYTMLALITTMQVM